MNRSTLLRRQGLIKTALDAGARPTLTPSPRLLDILPNGFPVYSVQGAEGGGYSTEADAINVGRLSAEQQANLQAMFSEFNQALDIYNEQRGSLVSLLSYPTTFAAEMIAQIPGGSGKFKEASEFGLPESINAAMAEYWFGYSYKDLDLATRFTWKFLRDADPRQVEAVHDEAMSADAQMLLDEVMGCLFGLRTGVNEHGQEIRALYDNDDMVPPNWLWTPFSEPHTHYLVSGSPNLDGADLRDLRDTVRHHGYPRPGGRFVCLVHPSLGEVIARFRAGDVAGNPYDYIPSPNAPARYNNEGEIVGQLAPATWAGQPVAGQWGDVLIIEHEYMPLDYVAMIASSGPGSTYNPVALRQHANPAYQGLRLIPGIQQRYPLVDSIYSRGFGTGIRHRGSAAILQVTASAEYEPPSQFA